MKTKNELRAYYRNIRREMSDKENKDRLIFVTNDDGYSSKGFAAAIEVARRFGRVIAVAPERMQSGMSQAITIYNPLYLRKVRDEEDVTVYAVSGTPVDCVKIAFDHLLAGEIPAIGLSVTDHAADADFAAAVEYGVRIAGAVLENKPQLPLCLNVNVPAIPREEIKGMKICRQTRGYWREDFFRREDPHGRQYFWMTGAFDNHEPEADDSDEWALNNGYVSVVPIQVDMTAYSQMAMLERIL